MQLEYQHLNFLLQTLDWWQVSLLDLRAAVELLGSKLDVALFQEAEEMTTHLGQKLDQWELQQQYASSYDFRGVFLEIQASTNDADTQYWTEMLLRMYGRFGELNNYPVRLIDEEMGEIGWKSVTIEINAYYAYGYLRTESGVHRLTRISPFSVDQKTSLAIVRVMPILDDLAKWQIPEADLQVVTFDAPRGNVNRLDLSIKVIHSPTGVSAVCRDGRSQGQNKAKAISVLKAKLFAIAQAQGVASISEIQPQRIATIRSELLLRDYLFDESRVKDHRTGEETTNLAAVLDGELDRRLSLR